MQGTSIATRKVYGMALEALGNARDDVVVLDGDVKNSTFTDMFEKKFPERFIQCFIAEQNMVGVATGLELRGKRPFAATFGAFFSRAFDQIRMAGIGQNALRLCGSHCGVSIGADGPSQMGLEDLALMRSVPNSVVLYPSDGVATYKLVEAMANYHDGISYLRTTRASTPVLYGHDELFPIGGSKVLKHSDEDVACIVAAGITLHEALKAHDLLKEQGINTAIIDAYSIKPLDRTTIARVTQKAGGTLLCVEDHYRAGGLGEAVLFELRNSAITIDSLYVKKVSRSGSPEELLKDAQIDSSSITKHIQSMLTKKSS